MGASGKAKPDAILIDCHHAGISGDMLLGALIDLGASRQPVAEEVATCTSSVGSVELRAKRVKRASMACTKADFVISDSDEEVDMEGCVRRASDPWVRKTSLKVLDTLMRAESRVHGRRGSQHHHLHELGRIDAVADIVGVLTAWKQLGLDELDAFSTRVALGGGRVAFSHGDFPVPAPATLEILKGAPVSLGGDRELTTPTGASLLVNLAHDFVEHIDIIPTKTGLGAGSDVGDFLNATRLVLGRRGPPQGDFIDMIETSIDDATPETLAHATERLMKEGALDVSIIPSLMKKGRPGSLVRVMASTDSTDHLSRTLLAETGSLGARIHRGIERRVLRRKMICVNVRIGGRAHKARLKLGLDDDDNLVSVKPEYSDVTKICRSTGLSFPTVYRAIVDACNAPS